MKTHDRRLYCFLAACIPFLVLCFTACNTRNETVLKDLNCIELPQNTEGLITFLYGNVYLKQAGSDRWEPLAIGSTVTGNDSIKADMNSYCEIQFGQKAVIRMDGNTEITIINIATKTDETNIDFNVTAGTVLNAVNKLGGKDRFLASTNDIVCGAYGTKFLVSADSDQSSVLAVKEGRVLLTPTAIDLESVREKYSGNAVITAILDRLESSLPNAESGEQIIFAKGAAMQTQTLFNSILDTLNLYSQTVEKNQDENQGQQLLYNVETDISRLMDQMNNTTGLSEENKTKLKELETMQLIDFDPAAASSNLIKVTVQANVPGTQLFLDGKKAGVNKFAGIFREGQTLNILAIKPGYEKQTLTFNVTRGNNVSYLFSMERAKTASTPVDINIKAVPSTAEILLNDRVLGIGAVKQSFIAGETAEFLIRDEGYHPQILSLTITENMPDSYEVSLLKIIEARFNVSSAQIIGRIGNYRNVFVTSDANGVLNGNNLAGKPLWTIPSANNPNENSIPVIIEDKIYFSGSKEFIIAEASSGKILLRNLLPEGSRHLFGRRVIAYKGLGIFPADNSLELLDLASGTVKKKIQVPGSSRMTPTVYNDKILIVNLLGQFLIIDIAAGIIEQQIETSAKFPIAASITVGENKALFTGNNGKTVCIDLTTNRVLWEKNLTDRKSVIFRQDLEIGNDRVYAYADGILYCLSLDTGAKIFSLDQAFSAPPLFYDDSLYIGDTEGRLIELNAATTSVKTSIELDDIISTKPVLYLENRIVVGTQSGGLIIINP